VGFEIVGVATVQFAREQAGIELGFDMIYCIRFVQGVKATSGKHNNCLPAQVIPSHVIHYFEIHADRSAEDYEVLRIVAI